MEKKLFYFLSLYAYGYAHERYNLVYIAQSKPQNRPTPSAVRCRFYRYFCFVFANGGQIVSATRSFPTYNA